MKYLMNETPAFFVRAAGLTQESAHEWASLVPESTPACSARAIASDPHLVGVPIAGEGLPYRPRTWRLYCASGWARDREAADAAFALPQMMHADTSAQPRVKHVYTVIASNSEGVPSVSNERLCLLGSR